MSSRAVAALAGLATIAALGLAACTGTAYEGDPKLEFSGLHLPKVHLYDIGGVVSDGDGNPLDDAWVTVGDAAVYTDASGEFAFTAQLPATVLIERPGYEPFTFEATPGNATVAGHLTRRVVRGLRLLSSVAGDDDGFQRILDLAAGSTVNALVFDTKDETARVMYSTEVPQALELGFIADYYDPAERIAQAHAAGLYAITRVVTFEDANWSAARPDHQLALTWIDPMNTDAWEYPLGLAVEACELGFDEVQFDYVRFPTGAAARVMRESRDLTEEDRVGAITAFLTEAVDRLHPLGCAVSADIFGIVLSFGNDQGIGQRLEDVSGVVDAISPMVYPSHYGAGWIGLDNPNDYPGEVVAYALDGAMPRMSGDTELRPWLQAFYYDSSQILAQITEAEDRGAGWILWNYPSNFSADSLPPAT